MELTVVAEWFPIAESDEDLESVHEAMDELAKSSATKRSRAKNIVKQPEQAVSFVLVLAKY